MQATRPQLRKWILLRGLARHQLHWGDFPQILKKNFPEAEFLTIDTNGNGTRAEFPSFEHIEDSVEDLRQRTKEFRSGEPVGLLTISLGGMLGICWAQNHSEEVAGLICINSSDARLSPFYHRMRPEAFFHLLKMKLFCFSAEKREAAIMETTIASFRQRPENFQKFIKLFANSPMTSFGSSIRQLRSAMSFSLPEKAPKLPMLLLAGLGDPLVNPLCTKKIAEAWNVRAVYHTSAGHDIPLEDPQWIADQMQIHFDLTR